MNGSNSGKGTGYDAKSGQTFATTSTDRRGNFATTSTGHRPGDWKCRACSFINWNNREFCLSCKAAYSNDGSHSRSAQDLSGKGGANARKGKGKGKGDGRSASFQGEAAKGSGRWARRDRARQRRNAEEDEAKSRENQIKDMERLRDLAASSANLAAHAYWCDVLGKTDLDDEEAAGAQKPGHDGREWLQQSSLSKRISQQEAKIARTEKQLEDAYKMQTEAHAKVTAAGAQLEAQKLKLEELRKDKSADKICPKGKTVDESIKDHLATALAALRGAQKYEETRKAVEAAIAAADSEAEQALEEEGEAGDDKDFHDAVETAGTRASDLKADELKGCLENSFLTACTAAGIAIPTTFSEKLAAQLQSTLLAYLRGDQANLRGAAASHAGGDASGEVVVLEGAALAATAATNEDMLEKQRSLQLQAEALAAEAEAAARADSAGKGKGQKRTGDDLEDDKDKKGMDIEEKLSG